MEELISVIIPVYKVEAYLDRCMASVLSQTYTSTEIILVDDGSPDNCPAMCDAYAAKDPRVQVIHQQNKGLSGARNSGIEIARGEYIAFIDSDDYWEKDFLQCLYEAVTAAKADVAVGRWIYVHGDVPTKEEIAMGLEPLKVISEGKKTEFSFGTGYVYESHELLRNLYSPDGALFVVAWNKLYRRSLFDGIRYPEGRIHEDEATTHRLYHAAETGVFVDKPLYDYFVSPVSITHGFNPKRGQWLTALSERCDFLAQNGYEDLMIPTLKALCDGAVDIYFGWRDARPDEKKELRKIRRLIADSVKRAAGYGSFGLRTSIGYRLFLICPPLYRKLLGAVASENGKQ